MAKVAAFITSLLSMRGNLIPFNILSQELLCPIDALREKAYISDREDVSLFL